ncbi:MAG: GspH/FimT family pseudopilin [Comamonas sp.]|jgi:type IV fimbrial biogenesis protein FimT|uniref:GspH/FimT family pseudopilin n=1 Tax=Comamonas sp. TaxID=34028 RepID=UPI002FCB245B
MPTFLKHPDWQKKHRPQLGLTLIELIVCIAVVAVLVGIALPSFTPLIERWRASQATSDLESALMLARNESIRRGGGISLIRNAPDENCAAADNEWQCGWVLSLDSDQDGTADDESTPLQIVNGLNNLTVTASADSSAIIMDRWGGMQLLGEAAGKSFNLAIRPTAQPETQSQILCIKPGGHLQKVKLSSNC